MNMHVARTTALHVLTKCLTRLRCSWRSKQSCVRGCKTLMNSSLIYLFVAFAAYDQQRPFLRFSVHTVIAVSLCSPLCKKPSVPISIHLVSNVLDCGSACSCGRAAVLVTGHSVAPAVDAASPTWGTSSVGVEQRRTTGWQYHSCNSFCN